MLNEESQNIITKTFNKFISFRAKGGPVTAKLGKEYCTELLRYYKELYDRDMAKGRDRKGTYLASVLSKMSNLKKRIYEYLGKKIQPSDLLFLSELKLSGPQLHEIRVRKSQQVHNKGIHLQEIDVDAVIEDCRELLDNENPFIRVIAIACLTGRRMSEIILTMTFEPPQQHHATSNVYWVKVVGFGKQVDTKEDRKRRLEHPDEEELEERSREIPLFDTRARITAAVDQVRRELPCSTVEEVNRLYAKRIQRRMQKYCPQIGNLHNFRKMYAITCFHYFNENSCSLPRLAAEYLGHKTTSEVVITYLNFKVSNKIGRLNFGKP